MQWLDYGIIKATTCFRLRKLLLYNEEGGGEELGTGDLSFSPAVIG